MTLNNIIVFYVPSTDYKQGVSLKEFHNRVDQIAGIFSDWFGGATIENVEGFYKAGDGSIVREFISKVVSFATAEALEQHRADLLFLASAKRNAWKQESIGVEVSQINGGFNLVEQ